MLPLIAMLMALAGLPGAQTAPAPQDGAAKPADPMDKMICKRFVETGSLVRGTKICKTKREWDTDRLNMRQMRSGPGVDPCRNSGQGGPC